jgi:hypothetical protein
MDTQLCTDSSFIPQKKRAFRGLVGSPLAEVAVELPAKRGRPRKYADSAPKMRNYRAREREKRILDELQRENSDSRGMFMTGAPKGRGLILTGGYTAQKLDSVDTARRRKENGQKVTPEGSGTIGGDEIEKHLVVRLPRQKAAPKPPKKMWCPTHSCDPKYRVGSEQQSIGGAVPVVTVESEKYRLECGCLRGREIFVTRQADKREISDAASFQHIAEDFDSQTITNPIEGRPSSLPC